MRVENMIFLFYVWSLSVAGSFFYGHEFGVLKGSKESKEEMRSLITTSNKQLKECHEVFMVGKIK